MLQILNRKIFILTSAPLKTSGCRRKGTMMLWTETNCHGTWRIYLSYGKQELLELKGSLWWTAKVFRFTDSVMGRFLAACQIRYLVWEYNSQSCPAVTFLKLNPVKTLLLNNNGCRSNIKHPIPWIFLHGIEGVTGQYETHDYDITSTTQRSDDHLSEKLWKLQFLY